MLRRIKSSLSNPNRRQPQHQPTSFPHSPLNDPNNEIRLIRISNVRESPDASTGPILEIDLFHTSLANAGSYVAVSYVWGDPTPVRKFICNGSEFYAPENTFHALYTIYHCTQRGSTALYTKGETLTLWIDALCINQRCPREELSSANNGQHLPVSQRCHWICRIA
jgi:hypothetical protein